MKFPKMVRVEQHLESHKLDDPIGALEKELERVGFDKLIKPGERIAVCAGSRGINNLPDFIKCTVAAVKAAGATPFIVPAMGSHGGATAEGQKEVLTHMGITEEYCGAEIKSSMETVRLGEVDRGCAVHFDKFAYECDGVIPIARVKPHTDFKSEIESGLCKMLVIGLGKHAGARRDVPSLLAAADVCVLSTHVETFGVAVLEGMAEKPAAHDQEGDQRGNHDFEQNVSHDSLPN